MDKATFMYYANTYGGDLSIWPLEVIDSAEQALVKHPVWQELLTAEQDLDRRLNQYDMTEVSLLDLESKILDQTVNNTPLIDTILAWFLPNQSIWRPALAACLPVLIGLALGMTIDLEDQYLLSDEMELLADTEWLEVDSEGVSDEI